MLNTVLIIDKRMELSTKYKKAIENTDTQVLISRNLKDAFIYLNELEPDMVIISDSIEEKLAPFCQKIRALTYNTRPIIVALSKSADSQDKIDVLENGADDFLSEPVNIDEFKTRIKAHLRRDIELNLDTKTLLPNQKYVRKALKRTLNSDNQAVLLIELQNLIDYKSIYTEVASDKIIQTVVAIAKSTMAENDFIGQLNENSFVVVTNKYGAEKFAEFLTFAFDSVVSKFYSPEDSARGYMLHKGQRYAGMRVNFVSLLIGGISDGFNLIRSCDALLERLESVKNLAKIPYGSNYAFDRTKISASDSVKEETIYKNIYIRENDESLRLLIRTSLELQGFDILEDLDIESAVGPAIIICDCAKDCTELEYIRHLRSLNNFAKTKIIVTTTYHNKSAVLDSGADLYLPKPYEISDLIQWVEYFINK